MYRAPGRGSPAGDAPASFHCLPLQVKAGSVKQEFEKQDELKRSAMRAVVALLTIPEAGRSPIMADFAAQIRSNPELTVLFDSIQKDPASAPGAEPMELS